MRFELKLAYRHLVKGGGQTLLTVGAVAIAVTLIVFMQSLMAGVQAKTISDLAGSLAHVTVEPPDQKPRTLTEEAAAGDKTLYATLVDKQVAQRKNLANWRDIERQVARFPGVRVVAATARGDAFVIRGAKRQGANICGGDPLAVEQVYAVQKDMIAGRWLDIGADDIVIGWRMAEDAGIGVGDTVRIESAQGVTSVFHVAGLFDSGNDGLDRSRIYTTLRAAQSLFQIKEDVSTVDIKLTDFYQANQVADQIAATLPYKTESWMRQQPTIMETVNTQGAVKNMISLFALIASSFAIASVLIVSVIQKNKEIGILKSMGARNAQILRVFTLEGLGVALMGSVLGMGFGYVLVTIIGGVQQPSRFGKVTYLLNITINPLIFAGASLAAITATLIAAFLPALRAAKMNPVDVIRGG